MSQLSKKGSAKLLGPRAGPWLRDLAPQQPLVNTLIKNVQQLLKDKTKGFGVPCEHSLLQEEDELLPGGALPDGSKGQGWDRSGPKPSSPGTAKPPPGLQHRAPTALEERGNGHRTLRLCPEALKCTGVIILFLLFPD